MSSSERSRKWRQNNPAQPLLYMARKRAAKRGLPCALTLADVEAVIADWICVFCTAPVSPHNGSSHPLSPTLDRLIPRLGYTRSNTVLACQRCNSAKAEHTPASLRAWADKIERLIHNRTLSEEPRND